jgi:hypothetical protein
VCRKFGWRLLRRERRCRQPWLDDYVAELAGLHRAVASAVGASMWPRPIGCCPNCGAADVSDDRRGCGVMSAV